MATLDLGKIKLVNKNTWDTNTTYTADDIVQYTDNGILSTYICVVASSQGHTPSTNGTTHASWNFLAKGIADPIPTQTGNSGKILGTNGNALSWVTDQGGKLVKQHSFDNTAASISQSVAQGAISSTNFMASSFAATSSSNKVLWFGSITVGSDVSGVGIWLYADGSQIFGADAYGSVQRCSFFGRNNSQYGIVTVAFQYVIHSPSTNSVSYQIRCSQNDNATQTIYLNRPANNLDADYQMRGCSHMTFLEYTA